jgi:hypothetical protein
LIDEREGVAEVGWERVFGGEDVLAGPDLGGAVVAAARPGFPGERRLEPQIMIGVSREALGIEGGARPPRQAVAAAGWELGAA